MPHNQVKVQIAYIHGENVSCSFHHSLLRLANSGNPKLYMDNHISSLSDALSIPEARNALMKYFLDETDATHIWWIDTDMGFAADTVENLLQADKDVIGAVCKGMNKTAPDGFGGYVTEEFITAYEMIKIPTEESEIIAFALMESLDLCADLPIQVAGTGTACLLISRHAALAVRSLYGPRWFERAALMPAKINTVPNILGEDLSFCYRLATAGIPIFIHPKVKTTHAKTVWLQ